MSERGIRYSEGKARLLLVDSIFLWGLVKVLEFGAKKYAAQNWRKGLPVGETTNSLLRHLYAWLGGEETDSESGLHHLDHVSCNAMFLRRLAEPEYAAFDDRADWQGEIVQKSNKDLTICHLCQKPIIANEASFQGEDHTRGPIHLNCNG